MSCIDLLVLNPDAEPVVAIEFDGPTHDEPKRKEKDSWKDLGLAQLGIPCIRVPYWHRLNQSGELSTKEKEIEKEHKLYFAFVFSFLVEGLHRKRELRLYEEYVEHNIDRYMDHKKSQTQDPHISKIMEDFSRTLEELELTEKDKFKNVQFRTFDDFEDWEKHIYIANIECFWFEQNTSVGNESGLVQEILETTRSKEMYLRKAYGENSLQLKFHAHIESRTLKAVLVIQNESGSPIHTMERSLRPLPGSWRRLVKEPRMLDYAFLRSQLIDLAYWTMVHRFREKG